MSSTYLNLHYHIVFGTKNRGPSIPGERRTQLHDYLGGSVRGLKGYPQGINGTFDHVHILTGLRSTHRLSDFLRELKKASSHWMRTELGLREFAWQEGYAAFTVSEGNRVAVKRYIANQMEHHRFKSFREEFVEMLERAGIEYDPKYLD